MKAQMNPFLCLHNNCAQGILFMCKASCTQVYESIYYVCGWQQEFYSITPLTTPPPPKQKKKEWDNLAEFQFSLAC